MTSQGLIGAEILDLAMSPVNGVKAVLFPQKRDPDADVQLDDVNVYKPVLYSISFVLLFKALCAGMMVNTRVATMIDIYNGNTAMAALTLGRIQSLGAILEFVVGPFLGRLSDVSGRRFVMQLAPIAIFVNQVLMLWKPKALWVHYVRVPVIALDTAFFAAMRAMQADVMSGRNIAENGFIHMALAGYATVAAPLLAARLSRMSIFRLTAALAGVCVFIVRQMQETLPPRKRSPPSSLDIKSCNPFAFYQLFMNGRSLAILSSVTGIQTFTDPRLMDECATLVMREKLKWTSAQVDRQLSVMSISLVSGVGVGKFSVKYLGRLMHTHVSHAFKIATYLLWSRAHRARTMRFTQVLLLFGHRQRDGVETLITEVGALKGFGKGQIEAYKMNLRSVSNLVAPLIFARLFATGKALGDAALPFGFAAICSTVAELVFLCLRKEEVSKELGVNDVQ